MKKANTQGIARRVVVRRSSVHGHGVFALRALDANCKAVEIENHVFIHASTAIAPGEELFLDYQVVVDEPADEEARPGYICRCGAWGCRGTMPGVAAS
ncbi:SET domain-containing protein-lysine N-methyltransferase [Paraburkholderia sp. WC7.3b]|uniref:SET domain-containing protein-lysine N-methyltransferase n=2 Tax=Burkholderiaceae TaxID=119060 RepID=A0ABR7PSR4_9BURK|nr:SET domain-containing protein-lysine N-methyltransferase [Paraburkholderia podalyriae]